MNLNARLSRMEAQHAYSNPPVVIVAEDQEDFDRQFEDTLLAARPGLMSISGVIGAEAFRNTIDLLPHEDTLELLSCP